MPTDENGNSLKYPQAVIPAGKNGSGPKYTPPKPKPANVTPVDKWSIASVLFWNRDKNGKVKPPNS